MNEAVRPGPVDILMREYDQRRNELIAMYTRYDKQGATLTGYLAFVAPFTLAILSLTAPDGTIVTPLSSVKLQSLVQGHTAGFALMGVSAGVLAALFLISNLMEIMHVMHLMSAQSAALEFKINELMESDLLTWDSKLIPEFYETRRRAGLFVEPSWLVGFWALWIFAIIIGIFTYIAWLQARQFFLPWAVIAMPVAIYHVCEWFWVATRRKKTMVKSAIDSIKLLAPPEPTPSLEAEN